MPFPELGNNTGSGISENRNLWIKTVYCDSCWTPTKDGWKDITELKDFVDINSFHLDTTDNEQGGDFYEDNCG